MSKTSASIFCETNQMRGLPQENVFLQNFYRLPADYSMSFQRSASSTAPIQICAVTSAQGDDTVAAMALQEVMKILSDAAARVQSSPALNFDVFINDVILQANDAVCSFTMRNQGVPVRVSMTMLVIEKDTVRIVSIGNTSAVLIRQGRVVPLTEPQTVAHRYVQMGAISPEAELTHPERNVLTQYIGRFPQDGPVLPDKKIYMRLADGDEICLLGTGVSQGLSDSYRNAVLTKPVSPEQKTAELIRLCMQNQIKGGLTLLHLRVESTLVMPAAGMMAAAASAARAEIQADPNQRLKDVKKAKAKAILVPVSAFLGCVLAGYFGLMLAFNVGNLMMPAKTETTADASLNKIEYINADMVAFYPEASLDSTPSAYLSRGDVVTLLAVTGSFSQITTTDGATGYVVSSMLSESDPTIGESLPEMSADPTPIPSQQQTAVTIYETETQASESAATTTSASETTTTTTTSSSETTTTDITTATDSTITTDATATDETTAADTTTAADATTTTTPATTTTAP